MTSRELPIFPLGSVIFPGQTIGLCIFEDRYRELLNDVQETHEFGTCLLNATKDSKKKKTRSPIGTMVQVMGVQTLDDGKVLVAIQGKKRFKSLKWLDDAPYPRAIIKEQPCTGRSVNQELLASAGAAVRALRAIHSEVRLDDRLDKSCTMEGSDKAMVWQLVALAPISVLDQYRLLDVSNPNMRLRLLKRLCTERFVDYQRLMHMSANGSEWSANL